MTQITQLPVEATDFQTWFRTSFFGPGAINASYGTIGDNVADDAEAIQIALDIQIYGLNSATGTGGGFTALLPNIHRTTKSIHLGYGSGFHAGRLKGSGAAFQGEVPFGSGIRCGFSDRPGIVVQGGRMSEISDLGILGKNKDWIENAGYPGTDIADWIDPTLHANANSRYAPYAAIAVDPFSGTRPATSYPDVDYPSWTGISTQYGKNLSSNTLIDQVHIRGFVVGVVNAPADSDGNGDYTRLHNVIITACAYAVSIGNSQSRCAELNNVFASQVHTFLTNKVHGRQLGKCGPLNNCHVGSAVQVFDIGNASVGGPFVFNFLYTEDIWRIGSLSGATSVEQSLHFIGCLFSFDSHSTATEYGIPAVLLSSSVLTPLIITGGALVSFSGVATLHVAIAGVTIKGLQIESLTRTALYEKFAHNALCGGLAFKVLGYGSSQGNVQAKFSAFDLDTGDDLGAVVSNTPYPSKRNRCTPLWVRRHCGISETDGEGVHIPRRVDVLDFSSLSAVRSGRTVTITFSARTDADFMREGPLPGDVCMHALTGATFFVKARTGLVVTLYMQTNYKADGTLVEAMDITSGSLYVANSRCYSPAFAIFGDFTATSNIITNVGRADGYHGLIEENIAVGDYLLIDTLTDGTIAQVDARVTARSNAAQTITLSGNAALTIAKKRLGTFIRLPAPNA